MWLRFRILGYYKEINRWLLFIIFFFKEEIELEWRGILFKVIMLKSGRVKIGVLLLKK